MTSEVAGEIIIEGQDADMNGKPDWKVKIPIKDKRLWAIIVGVTIIILWTKTAGYW